MSAASSLAGVIGVVIPYFQRKPGLLARAVGSALAQEGETAESVAIFVVDDGSPLPARDELAALPEAARARVTLIEQKNAGVAAARNAALDAMPGKIELIAFLDSDDAWRPSHLANARAALRQGADFYFADHKREGAALTRFAECGIDAKAGEKLPEGSGLYRFTGDLFATILRKSPVGTPTVVFRRAFAPNLRFRAGLSAREDTLFWLSLVHRGACAAFSLNEVTDCGLGVNIFAAAGWGSPSALTMLVDVAAFHRMVPEIFPLSPDLAAWNADWRRQVRRDFALNLLHLLRHREKIDWRSVRRFLRAEPALLADIAAAPLRRGH
jgi:succinoglycan biosynthesis protein ExoW